MLTLHSVDLDGAKFVTIAEIHEGGRRSVRHLVGRRMRAGFEPGVVQHRVMCGSQNAIEVYPGDPPECVACQLLAAGLRTKNKSEIYG